MLQTIYWFIRWSKWSFRSSLSRIVKKKKLTFSYFLNKSNTRMSAFYGLKGTYYRSPLVLSFFSKFLFMVSVDREKSLEAKSIELEDQIITCILISSLLLLHIFSQKMFVLLLRIMTAKHLLVKTSTTMCWVGL